MSLEEITRIINSPKLTAEVVGGVLNIFREEGNSFIRPFKTEDPSTHKLLPGTVLDITHESLIRNWNKLNEWANREFEFYSTFLDFQKQLDRWKKSGKSRGYLLPVGPLSYFENWYNKCKPNTGWIMRYAESREDQQQALRHAEETLTDTREFLKRSARKEMVTRAFMKYGPQRIATIFAILVMLILSGFYWYDADQKKNERVIERVKSESFDLLKSKEVNLSDKAIFLLAEERHDSGSLMPYLKSLEFRNRISVANEVYKQLLSFDKHQKSSLKSGLFELVTKNLSASDSSADPEFLLTETNKFLILLLMDQYYAPDNAKQEMLFALAEKNYNLILRFYNNKNLFHPVVPSELNMAVQMWLTIGKATPAKVQDILNSISPLAGKDAENAFNTYYAKGSFEPDGRQPFDFNGGYHTLASLYAATGDIEHVLWCFEKLLENNQRDYFELPRILNNHLNVLEYLYQYGHRDRVPAFLQWMADHTADNPPATILRNAVLRSGYISHLYNINVNRNYYRSTRGYLYPNLCLCDRSVFDAMAEDYDNIADTIANLSERNFTLAVNHKREAMFYTKYWYDRQMPMDEQRLNNWLGQSIDLYAHIDKNYLEGKESSTLIYNGDGVRTRDVKRNDLFIYPDYRDGWFSWTYHTDYFFNYLRKNGLLSSMYKTGADLQLLHFWIAKAYEWKTDISINSYSNTYPLPDEVLKNILTFVDQHSEGKEFDRNLLYLLLSNHAFEKGDTINGIKYYQDLDLQTIQRSSDRYEYLEKIFFLNMMKDLCVNLAAIGKTDDAIAMAEKFSLDEYRIFGYMQMASKVYSQNANPLAFVFLDSVYAKAAKIDFTSLNPELDSRYGQIKILSQIGSRAINNNADEILRDIPEAGKFDGVVARVTGIAGEGNYYRALTSIPKTLTESQDLECRTMILLQDCRAKESLDGNTKWKAFDNYLDWTKIFVDYIPN
jgi:hypothetical protein